MEISIEAIFSISNTPTSRYPLDQSQVSAHMSHGLTEKIFFIRESIQFLIATAGWLDIFP